MKSTDSPKIRWTQLDFFERQQCNSSCSRIREISLKQRRNVAAKEIGLHVLTGGGGDLEGLRMFLKHKYQTIARGWRVGLDIRGIGRISSTDFSRALRNSGYAGNVQTLWRNISDGAVHVTLDHIDADLCSHFDWVVTEFYNGYDSVEDFWAALASHRANAAHMTKLEFAGALKKVGLLPPDWKEWFKHDLVFQMLDAEGRGHVTLQDMQYLDTWGKQRGIAPVDEGIGLIQASLSSVPKHRMSVVEERRDAVAKAQKKELNRKRSAVDIREFRSLLERRFGSVVNAWMAGLDMDGNGKLTMREFSQACRNIGFGGAIAPLWAELDKQGAGYITLGDLDREAHEALSTLQKEIASRYSSINDAWTHLLDVDGSGRVDRNEFVNACAHVGIGPHVGNKIFGCIDSDSTGCITPEELAFLESWGAKPQKKEHYFNEDTYVSKWRAKTNHREIKLRMRRTKSFESMHNHSQRSRGPIDPGGLNLFYKRSLQLLADHDERFAMFSTWS